MPAGQHWRYEPYQVTEYVTEHRLENGRQIAVRRPVTVTRYRRVLAKQDNPNDRRDPALNPLMTTTPNPYRVPTPVGRAERSYPPSTQQFVEQLRNAKSDRQKKSVEKNLRKHLEGEFEKRMESRQHQLEHFRERLEKLQNELTRREKAKDEIIDLRLKTLINEAAGLGF